MNPPPIGTWRGSDDNGYISAEPSPGLYHLDGDHSAYEVRSAFRAKNYEDRLRFGKSRLDEPSLVYANWQHFRIQI